MQQRLQSGAGDLLGIQNSDSFPVFLSFSLSLFHLLPAFYPPSLIKQSYKYKILIYYKCMIKNKALTEIAKI